ncbi:MAG: alpha-keto acid decarboxylase family protein [Methanosarcinales archaeon]
MQKNAIEENINLKGSTIGEYLFEKLSGLGVEYSFGIPGDFVLPLYKVQQNSKIKTVVVTHEPSAGFAADAYARVKGIGVAIVTYGVGALNMVNPIALAYAEKSPVVVISGAPGLKERETNALLHHQVKTYESQRKIFEEITEETVILDDQFTAADEIDRVLQTCKKLSRPVYIEVPRDMVNRKILFHRGITEKPKTCDLETLEEAITESLEMINNSRHPAILAGVEAHRFGLQKELIEFAEKTGIPVSETLLGKSVFPGQHPLYLGVYAGAMSSDATKEYIENSDCLIMIGVMLTDVNLGLFTAKLEQSKIIFASEENIIIKHHQYPNICFSDFFNNLISKVKERKKIEFPRVNNLKPPKTRNHITMQDIIYIINNFIDKDTIIITDVGDCMFSCIDLITPEHTTFLAPAYYESMGFAVPGAIGAQLASNRRPLVVLGDGAFQMTGMELSTAKRLGLNPIVIVLNNGCYGTLRSMNKEINCLDIAQWNYAEIAKLLGGNGYVVDTAQQFRDALKDAKAKKDFSIIDVHIDKEDISPALLKLSEEWKKRVKM